MKSKIFLVISVGYLALCGNFVYAYTNPLGNITSFPQLIGNTAKAVPLIILPFAVIAVVIVGLRFITHSASGNSKGLEEDKKILLWVLIGAAVTIGAGALAQAVVSTIKNLGGESSSSSFSVERSQQDQRPGTPKEDDAETLPPRKKSSSQTTLDREDQSLQETVNFFKEHGAAEDITGFQDLHLPSSLGISPDGQVLVIDDKKVYGTYDISEGPGAKLLQKTCPACLVLGGDITEEMAKDLAEKVGKARERLGNSYGRYLENPIFIPASSEVGTKIKRDVAQHYAELAADGLKFGEGGGRTYFVQRRTDKILDGDIGRAAGMAFSDGSVYLNPSEKDHGDHVHDENDTLVHELAHIKTFEKLGINESSLKSFKEQFNESEIGREFVEIYDKSLSLGHDNVKVSSKTDTGFCSDYGSKNVMESIAECVRVATSGGPYYSSYIPLQLSAEEKNRFPEFEQKNKTVREGNALRYEHYKLLHQHGFIPKLPPPPSS